jgi:hypothetical protein
MNHWASLTGQVAPPAWHGPVRSFRMDDDEPLTDVQPRVPRTVAREDLVALRALQRRALSAVLQVCPAWTLIAPGSPHEALMRQVPAGVWWPRLEE